MIDDAKTASANLGWRRSASELRSDHEHQGEAQSNSKMRLDAGETDEADGPGNKNQARVVQKIIGDQKKKISAEAAHHAAKDIQQSEMLRPDAKTMNADCDKHDAQDHHHQRETVFAQNPVAAARNRGSEGVHRGYSRGTRIGGGALAQMSSVNFSAK
jgi:hypothetical protein